MLIGNFTVLHKSPARFYAGASGTFESSARSNWGTSGSILHRTLGAFDKTASIPTGYRPPYTWAMARVTGELGSSVFTAGSASASGGLVGGLNAEADLTGAGEVLSASLSLIVSALADLSGSGDVLADIVGRLDASADLAGAGDVTAAIAAFASIVADLTGAATVTASPFATADMSADINVTGDLLTTANVAAAVWDAAAAAYNAAGSMGALMNTGAAGLTAEQVWEYTTRTLTASGSALTNEQATQLLEIFQRLGLDPSKPLAQTATQISTDDWTLTVTEALGTVTVERQP